MTRTILIVDDHPSFRASARMLLESEGPDGLEVAARLSENGSGPAIVLTSSRDLADLALVRERCPVHDPTLPQMRGHVEAVGAAAALALDNERLDAELPDERLPEAVELTAYFVVAEALTDVAKYAWASHATVQVERDNGRVMVEVADGGVGGADPGRGTGLRGLSDRLAVPEGRLEVESEQGHGTTVSSVLLREGVVRLLEEKGFDVVAQAGDAEDLIRKVNAHKPDVAVVDIRMPPTNTDDGLRAALEIRAALPDTGVLVLSQYVEEGYALELVGDSAGGVGYLLKDRVADVDRFVEARGRGGSALDPEVVAQLVGRARRDDPLAELTPREREVLELMAEGRSNNAIATQIVVTERAVEKHVTSIFGKLGLPPAPEDHRRVLAVLAFLRA
jgi:DNA-binding NarL/FixJ family response regulator